MQLKDGNRNGLQMAKSICVIPGIADLILLNSFLIISTPTFEILG